MQAGKHVYSAVPIITLDNGQAMLDWCDKIIDTCKRTGMHYMMGETSHYRPQAMYCRRQAAARAFGEFVYAEGAYLHDIDCPAATSAMWRSTAGARNGHGQERRGADVTTRRTRSAGSSQP